MAHGRIQNTSISQQQPAGHLDLPPVVPIRRQPYRPRIPHFIKKYSGPFTVPGNQYYRHSCCTIKRPFIWRQPLLLCQSASVLCSEKLAHLDTDKDDSDRANVQCNGMKMALRKSGLSLLTLTVCRFVLLQMYLTTKAKM